MTAKTAKFWYFHNGSPVRIKIAAGESLRHWHGGPTDEGYSSETNVWTFDGGVVRNEWRSDGRDCDGRLVQYGEVTATIETLRAGYVDPDCEGVTYPAWQWVGSGQRDYSAEAAGY